MEKRRVWLQVTPRKRGGALVYSFWFVAAETRLEVEVRPGRTAQAAAEREIMRTYGAGIVLERHIEPFVPAHPTQRGFVGEPLAGRIRVYLMTRARVPTAAERDEGTASFRFWTEGSPHVRDQCVAKGSGSWQRAADALRARIMRDCPEVDEVAVIPQTYTFADWC